MSKFTRYVCMSTGARDEGDTMHTIAKLKHEVRLTTHGKL